MKKIGFLIILVLVLIVSYALIDFQSSESFKHTQGKLRIDLVEDLSLKPKLTEVDDRIEESAVSNYLRRSLGAKFDNSDDLHALSLVLYNSATRGDNEAQFYLAKAILYCHSPDIPYTEIDSAVTIELHDWMRTRCAGFVNQNIEYLGKAEDWIELSYEGKYPQAIVANLIMQGKLPLTSATLSDIHLALSSRNSEVMNLIGSLGHSQKNRITHEAWKLLACDFGHDCTSHSKDIWRLRLGSFCSVKMIKGEECKTDIDYLTYSKSNYTPEEFEQIMDKVSFLKDVIASDRINELTFDQIFE